MKRILALVFVFALIFSLAACKDKSETKNTTQITTTSESQDNTENTTASTDTQTTTTEAPASQAKTVEEWIAANKDLVDEYCNAANESVLSSYTGDDTSFNIEFIMEANENDFIMKTILTCNDETILSDFIEMIESANYLILRTTIEEQEEALKSIPEQYGFTDMPVPESCTSVLIDKNGDVVMEMSYPSEPIVITDTVEEWIENNEELVKEICEDLSYSLENYDVSIELKGEGNILHNIATLSGNITEEEIELEITAAKEEQEYWDSLTDEDKAYGLKSFAFSFHHTIPIPDKIITTVCTEDGNVITEVIYS